MYDTSEYYYTLCGKGGVVMTVGGYEQLTTNEVLRDNTVVVVGPGHYVPKFEVRGRRLLLLGYTRLDTFLKRGAWKYID